MVGSQSCGHPVFMPKKAKSDASFLFSASSGSNPRHLRPLFRMSLATGAQTVKIGGSLFLNDTKSDSIDTGYNMYLFACNQDGAPTYAGKSRLYWMKLYQNGNLVRDFKPVRLNNGLVVLWDLAEDKPYPAQSVSASGNYTFFSAVGPEGDRIYVGTKVIIR